MPDKRGGYSGGQPAADMSPPAPIPSEGIATTDDRAENVRLRHLLDDALAEVELWQTLAGAWQHTAQAWQRQAERLRDQAER